MTCVRFQMGGRTGFLTFADESEPFVFERRRWVVHKMFGPIAVNKHGDPLDNQPTGRQLQRAFEHYERARKATPGKAGA